MRTKKVVVKACEESKVEADDVGRCFSRLSVTSPKIRPGGCCHVTCTACCLPITDLPVAPNKYFLTVSIWQSRSFTVELLTRDKYYDLIESFPEVAICSAALSTASGKHMPAIDTML